MPGTFGRLYCFTLISCFTMLPFGQITCFLDVWDILYYFTIFSTWLYYIFILLQIYYIANVSCNWVFLSCCTFTQQYLSIYLKHSLSNVFYHIVLLLNWICCRYVLEGSYYFVLIVYFTILNFFENTSFSNM